MYGWRGRLGLIVPAANTVAEPEISCMVPEGIAVYTARLGDGTGSGLDRVKDEARDAERASRQLSAARVDVVAFACTTGSFFQGIEAERELCNRIHHAAGVPAVTAIGAVLEALQALRIQRLVLASPYTDEVNTLEETFLGHRGYRVLAKRGLAMPNPFDIGLLRDDRAYQLAMELLHPDAECILISCTNFPTLRSIDVLERDAGVPVVTSNQATAWACLRRLRVAPRAEHLGRLLSGAHYTARGPTSGSAGQGP
jgi:maleate cis-trans isomerase